MAAVLCSGGLREIAGWDGRIRTYDTLYQKQLPYHLATSHQRGAVYVRHPSGSRPEMSVFPLFFHCILAKKILGVFLNPFNLNQLV